jgi:Fic family protein
MSTPCYNGQLVDIKSALEAVRRLPPRAVLAREAARLRRAEVDGSLAIAGTPLTGGELDALADLGFATGGHALVDYIAARDLLAASAWILEQRPIAVGDPRPLITVEDVRRLHGLSTAGQPALRPGVWRLAVDRPESGIVSPAPWLITKETAALVERFRRRPPVAGLPLWIAQFLARYARIRPFGEANGRAGRLAAALLLRRLDVAPLAIPRERSADYRRAVLTAEGGNAQQLQTLIENTLLQSCRRLIAAAGPEPLVPLRALAGTNYAALIKAAKRGRLAVITRDGRVYSTTTWIEEYRNNRHST